MKKLLSASVLGLVAWSELAFAGCHLKCIARNPFNGKCVTKVNVCDIGSPSDWVEQSGNELARTTKGLENIWHEIYGSLPEEVRVVLNTHSFTILGAAYGGLEGAALGKAVDELLVRTRVTVQKTKQHIEAAPSWKAPIYHAGEEIAALKEGDIVFSGQASKTDLAQGIRPLHDEFLRCVDNAQELNQGWDCLDAFEDAVNGILREARRQ